MPALPVGTGQELMDSLLKQIGPFGAAFHLGQEDTHRQRPADGRFYLQASLGAGSPTNTVFIAAGVGGFQPRALKLGGIDPFLGKQLFNRVTDPAQFYGKNPVIRGGGDSALDGPRAPAGKAKSVLLVHRRGGFCAAPASVATMRQRCDADPMQFLIGPLSGFDASHDDLTAVRVTSLDGVTRKVPLDALRVFFGRSPRRGPSAHRNLEIERKQFVVGTEKLETRVPGIFAIGDINTSSGTKKRILCRFHEAALAAFGAAK